MNALLTTLSHNVAVLASLMHHPSTRLRNVCGKLQHEMRPLTGLTRFLSGDGRADIAEVVSNLVKGIETVHQLLQELQEGASLCKSLTAFDEMVRENLINLIEGIVTIKRSHYDGDVTIELSIDRSLRALAHAYPECEEQVKQLGRIGVRSRNSSEMSAEGKADL